MKSILFLSLFVWLSVSVGGAIYLVEYENTPGEANASHPSSFPLTSHLERTPDLPTLIFFAHPKCPCTRASLHELSRLMAEIDGRVNAYVVFIQPSDEDDAWTRTDLRTMAEAIPDVRVITDEDERETKIFGAQTSSLTLLYDQRGNLRFAGGLTASRGTEGDNAGSRTITQIITTGGDQNGQSPVFGCPMHQKDCPGQLLQSPGSQQRPNAVTE